jgi:hypothetical protein
MPSASGREAAVFCVKLFNIIYTMAQSVGLYHNDTASGQGGSAVVSRNVYRSLLDNATATML